MLDELLNREDVVTFINNLEISKRFYDKDLASFNNRNIYISKELALYTFYDAIYKFKVIVDNNNLFEDYLVQLEKLYRNVDNYDDIVEGINRLIGKMVIDKLKIKDITSKDSKEEAIKYIYDKYIVDGYYFHGFNNSYYSKMENSDITPEEYENLYEEFLKINKIFAKYNVINIIDKNFKEKEISFTDDFIMACYYSLYSPMFYSKFLLNEDYFGKKYRRDAYLIDSYNLLIKNLKRFMSNNLFSEIDRKYILDVVKKQWGLLHKENKRVCLLFVKRTIIDDNYVKLSEYLTDEDYYEIVDRMLSSKNSNIHVEDTISKENSFVVSLNNYYDNYKSDEEIMNTTIITKPFLKSEDKEFINAYGKVSILLIVGSLMITLGVIITLILLLGGF